jgi:glycine/D-amino acid oxidase-like deaminating enzyme
MALFHLRCRHRCHNFVPLSIPLLMYMMLLGLGMMGLGLEQLTPVGVNAWQSPSTTIRTLKVRNTILSMSSSSSSSLSSFSSQDPDPSIKASTPASSSMNSGISYQSSPPSSLPGRPSSSSPIVPQQPRRRQLHKDVVIVGGGLAGLSTALYLTQIDPKRRITIIDRNNDTTNDSSAIGGANPGNMASMAAAGMLAPHSERLPKGDYLDLCLASKRMYGDFVALVEGMAYDSGPDGHKYLWNDNDGDNSLEPWNIGYVASGGFLAPAFAGDNVATWMPDHDNDDDDDDDDNNENENNNDNPRQKKKREKKKKKKTPTAFWLDATQAKELEPHLHPEIVGGWWFPEDASVDARRLTCSLKAACIGAGVEFLCGSNNEVTSLDLQEGVCKGLWLGSRSGRYVSAKAILVANGAWMRNLLPVPLEPHKGQSLSLRMPKDRPPILRRVLFGGDSYIVPKADGRIVIGATVEAGSFDSNVTPAGIMHVLSHALQLVPALADLPIEETWAGLRPTTPDKGPILGETPWDNLFLAGGYWRNGVLLAPKTGHLLATLIASNNNDDDDDSGFDSEFQLSQEDQIMLDAFSWDRFTSPGGGKKMAANSRYAASMYPVHTRRSGTGIAAAVGTELGSYSTARSAGEERKKDRESLFGSSSSSSSSGANDGGDSIFGEDAATEDAFERAALLGMEDAAIYEGFDEQNKRRPTTNKEEEEEERPEAKTTDEDDELDDDGERLSKFYYSQQEAALQSSTLDVVESSSSDSSSTSTTSTYDGSDSGDAFTVGSSSANEEEANSGNNQELKSIYQSIRDNKSKHDVDLPEDAGETRPDPGFRIYHIDQKTGESRIIPPYTSPGEFFENLEAEKALAAAPEGKSLVPNQSFPQNNNNGKIEGDSADSEYDGYQTILDANSSDNRQDELDAMKEARRKNRSKGGMPEIRKK